LRFNELLGLPVFSFGCDFYDIFYNLLGCSANDKLS